MSRTASILARFWEEGGVMGRRQAGSRSPIMAMAADTVIVTAENIVPVGVIAPDHVVTPGPLVDYLVSNG